MKERRRKKKKGKRKREKVRRRKRKIEGERKRERRNDGEIGVQCSSQLSLCQDRISDSCLRHLPSALCAPYSLSAVDCDRRKARLHTAVSGNGIIVDLDIFVSSGRARAHMSTSSQIDNGWPGVVWERVSTVRRAGRRRWKRKRVDVLSAGIYNARGKVRRLCSNGYRYASFVDDNV